MSSGKVSANGTGKYVYGVMRYPEEEGPQPYFIERAALTQKSEQPLASIGNTGIGNRPVSAIPYRGIALVASDIHLHEARSLTNAINKKSADAGSIGLEYIHSHQRVIDRLRGNNYTVIPVRFGSVLSPNNARKLLQEGHGYFLEKLQMLVGKDEYGVTIVAQAGTEQKLDAIIMRYPEVSRLADRMQAELSSGQTGAHHFSSLKFEDLKRNMRFKIFDELAKDANQLLSAAAYASVPQKPTANNAIFSRAYLVDRAKLQEFNKTLNSLNERLLSLGVKIFKTGPWAPYSFSIDSKFSRAGTSTRGGDFQHASVQRQKGRARLSDSTLGAASQA
ncbi:MAG: GvpL/GvpF family gas vesicle protein [Nitrososphaera sp.]|jgi:hypothetical protein